MKLHILGKHKKQSWETDPNLVKILAAHAEGGGGGALEIVESSPLAAQRKTVVLEVGGEGVIERTGAIVRYLYAKKCAAMKPFQVATIDEWLAYSFSALDVAAYVAVSPFVESGKGDVESHGVAERAMHDLVKQLTPLERHLTLNTFLVGERFSLADVCVGGSLIRPFALILDPATRASSSLRNVTRWIQTVAAQPSLASLIPPFSLCAEARRFPAPTIVTSGGKKSTSSSSSAANASSSKPAATTTSSSSLPTSGRADSYATQFQRSRTRIRDLLSRGESAIGSQVIVCGWARTIRGTSADKGPIFIEMNDGSSVLNVQIVCEVPRTPKEDVEAVLGAGGTGASFRFVGNVVKSPAAGQTIEVQATSAEVVGGIPDASTYPLQKTKTGHSVEYLRTIGHLRPRTNIISCVARVRHACAMATHSFFDSRGFAYVHTPIITAADCEGAGEMFQVTTLMDQGTKLPPLTKDGKALDYSKDFFSKPAFLTVSGQLNVECYATALSDVYTFGPTFRAENSNTTRHLAEFWMIEPEMCFATLKDDMDLAEDFVKYVTEYVMERCPEDLAFFNERVEKGLLDRLRNVLETPFMRLTYTEAIEVLTEHSDSGKKSFEVTPAWGIDLGSEHERYLTEVVYKKPVILTNYPAEIKAFYMRRSREDPRTVEAMDVLVPKIGELVGGSARETDYAMLDARVKEHNLDMPFYMDLRRYGSVPHAGFGMGFERLVMFVTGMENIRDVIPFPRYPGHADF